MMSAKIHDGRVPIDFITPISWKRSMMAMMSVLATEKITVTKMIAKKMYIIWSKSFMARTRLGAISFQVSISSEGSPVRFDEVTISPNRHRGCSPGAR